MNTKWQMILGPPGTGKTTKLLSLMEEALKSGYRPLDIGFVSFTRKAAVEAKQRAKLAFGYAENEFQYFRTLHSLAFLILGLKPSDVLRSCHYIELSGVLGYRITGKYSRVVDDDYSSFMGKGDKMLFLENQARLMEVPLKEYWHEANVSSIDWPELERFSKTYVLFKERRFLVDFTDMILAFVKENLSAPLKILFVDEAQDLSSAQWKMVHKLAHTCEVVCVAGDDDQAIFQWAGADLTGFNAVPGERLVLDQSYRIPTEVHRVAYYVRKQIKNSQPKKWRPRTETGKVKFHRSLEKGDFDLSKGTWLLLARNNAFLKQFEELCQQQGLHHTSPTSKLDADTIASIQAWEQLRKGAEVPTERALAIYKLFSSGRGYGDGGRKKLESTALKTVTLKRLSYEFNLYTEAPWFEALDKIPAEHVAYYRAVRRRGESFVKDPRIKISTIHGAKGGEADNVLLLTEMTARTVNAMVSNPDSEHRVWYVAVTRARSELHIVRPQRHGYNLLGDLRA